MKNLPYDASEDDIAKVFAKCGKAWLDTLKGNLTFQKGTKLYTVGNPHVQFWEKSYFFL